MTPTTTYLEQPATGDIALAEVMQALGDPTRLSIVQTLRNEGERQCGTIDLAVSKATRSHHFKVLREAGITHTRVDGTARFVTLRDDDLESRFPGLLDAILTAAER